MKFNKLFDFNYTSRNICFGDGAPDGGFGGDSLGGGPSGPTGGDGLTGGAPGANPTDVGNNGGGQPGGGYGGPGGAPGTSGYGSSLGITDTNTPSPNDYASNFGYTVNDPYGVSPQTATAIGDAVAAGNYGQTSTNHDPSASSNAMAALGSVGLGAGANTANSPFGQSIADAVGHAMGMVGIGSMVGLNGPMGPAGLAQSVLGAALGSPTAAMSALGGIAGNMSSNPTGGPTGYAGGPTANSGPSGGGDPFSASNVSNRPPATSTSTSGLSLGSPLNGSNNSSGGDITPLNTIGNTTSDLSGMLTQNGPSASNSSSTGAPGYAGYSGSVNSSQGNGQGTTQSLGSSPLNNPMYDNTFVNGNSGLQPFVDPYSRPVPVT